MGKQTGKMFTIEYQDNNIFKAISPKLYKSARVKQDIEADISKYWGKHSLLGIIINQINTQNENYTQESYSPFCTNYTDAYLLCVPDFLCRREADIRL